MYIREVYNKNHELSFLLRCSGKDPLTRENKIYTKTYKAPPDLTHKKDIKTFKAKIQLEWQEKVKRLSAGISIPKNHIKLIDFAREYVESMLTLNPQGYSYYNSCKGHLKTIEKKLSKYYLSELSPMLIREFCLWLCERTYDKTTIRVKESLKQVISDKGFTLITVARKCNISSTTLSEALTVNKTVDINTAEKLCDFLKVNLEKYFLVKKEKVPYSWSANNGVRVFLHGVLQEAVRTGLIEHNFASSDYIRPLKGTKGQKSILENKEEISSFIECLKDETDLRKKTAFACYLFLGLRNAEVAGLSWKNIDLDKHTMVINQNTIYASGFGIVTKGTKTQNSNRTISIPKIMVEILSEYKAWWDNEKANTGDLWASTDKLFVQWNGKDMCGSTLAEWLKQWEIKHGLKIVTPHGLRHTNITMQIANGIDVKTVSARAGHSDIHTTLNIYTHYVSEADKQAANKIDELFNDKKNS